MKKNLVYLTALISGISIYLNKFAVTGIDSTIFTFSKNLLVSLFLLALLLMGSQYKELKLLKKKQWLVLLSIGLVGGSIPFILFFAGLAQTSGAAASMIHKSMFVIVSILAVLFLKERFNRSVYIASALLLFGNYLLLRPSFAFGLGELLILGASLFWAAESIISKHALKTISSNTVAAARMLFGSLFIFIYMAFTGRLALLQGLAGPQLLWIALTSVFLLGYVFTWYNGLKHVNVSTATSILLLGSPITALLTLISGTPMTIMQGLGNIILFLGVITFIRSTIPWKHLS